MNFRTPDHARSDLPAASVVFLVAVPLTLCQAVLAESATPSPEA